MYYYIEIIQTLTKTFKTNFLKRKRYNITLNKKVILIFTIPTIYGEHQMSKNKKFDISSL